MSTVEAKPGGVVFVAPGQGIKDWSDGIDILRHWPKAADIYDEILKATGVNIIEVCGNKEPVTDPHIVQPAALGIGYARADFLRNEVVKPDYLMGLSAGEFTVAAISGALSLGDAAKLSHQRGIFQQEVAGGVGSSVLVIHKRGSEQVRALAELAKKLPGVNVSNYHNPIMTGLAYTHDAYEDLKNHLSDTPGVRKVLETKIPFKPHSPEVEKAQKRLAELIDRTVTVKDATLPIVANKTGRLMKSARTIKRNLIWQTTAPTQLSRGMAYLISRGVEDYYDLGPDNSMSKLLGDFASIHSIRIHPVASTK